MSTYERVVALGRGDRGQSVGQRLDSAAQPTASALSFSPSAPARSLIAEEVSGRR